MAEVKPATDDNLQPFGNIVQSGCGVPKKWKRCSPKCCHRSRPLLEWVSTILCVFFYSCRWLFLSMLLHIHKYTLVWFNLPKESKWVDLNFFQLYIILIHIILAFYQNNSKYFDNLISFMTGPNQDKGKKTTESLGKEKVDSKIKTSEMPWSQRRGKVHSNPSLSVSFTNGVP